MKATLPRHEFAPPTAQGALQALALALAAHGLLLLALAWGVSWRQQAPVTSAEAELWAQVPQAAAPKPVEPPPAPPPAAQAPEVAKVPEAAIVTEREKKRLADEKQAEKQLEKQQEKQAAEQKRLDDQKKLEVAKRKEAQEQKLAEQRLELQRQENMKRIAGLAGASGSATATGTAQQSAGPSASYAGRIKARIKPNIVFTEDPVGNPTADIEVRTSPDGTIVSRKLLKSSGIAAWDEAVLRAVDKTEVLPRDVDGRVPSPLVIGFRPRD